ncbi:terpene synthase family protein [Streptomyces sp. G45]|uniref:terpene synthase family protein n=1 Tax=Streptomyces sp. G45 TaxID=3406627 RepID=UPI003C1B944D
MSSAHTDSRSAPSRCRTGLAGADVEVRPLPCLLPLAHHPAALQIEEETRAWARRSLGRVFDADIEAALRRRSPSWLIPCYPTASGERLLRLWKLDQVYFLFDDACMTGTAGARTAAEHCRKLAGQLRGQAEPATSTDRFLLGLVRDLTDGMPPGLRTRTLDGMATMLAGFDDQVARTRPDADAPLDWDTAREIRLRAVGSTCYLPWTEYVTGVDLTLALARQPLLRQTARLAGLQTLYVNELCSFRAEHFAEDHGNLICLMLSTGASLQEAFDLVAGHAAQAERDFVALRNAVLTGPCDGAPDVRAYLDALGHLISGATHWQFTTIRYHGPGFRCSPATGSTWTMHPDHTELAGAGPWPPGALRLLLTADR